MSDQSMPLTKCHFILDLAGIGTIGKRLGTMCRPGDVICLGGDLGAGKTTLTQAIAAGAGVDSSEYVCSPSFAIVHEYNGKIPIYHMDFYRLGNEEDIIEMGLDEYFHLAGITVIEWYEKAVGLLPDDSLFIKLSAQPDGSRSIEINGSSVRWGQDIVELAREASAFHD